MMATITHTVYETQLNTHLDLRQIASRSRDVVYTRHRFNVLRWKDRRVGGTCMIYKNGKIIHHGTKQQLRRYLRLVQKLGIHIDVKPIKLVTQSAVACLPNVNYNLLVKNLGANYEPELFHAVQLRRHKMHFTIFRSGKVCVMGVKSLDDVDAALIEIAWLQ